MVRINKRAARKLWELDKDFWIVPCNQHPKCGLLINKQIRENFGTFNNMIAHFEYYNCCNERGRYSAFYILE